MINTRSFTDALQYKASRYLSFSSSLRPLPMKATLPVLLLALAFSAQAQDTTLPADVGTATALATGAPVLGSSDSDIGTTVPGVSDGGGTTLSFEATDGHKRCPIAVAHHLQQPVRVRDVDDGAVSVKHVGGERLRDVGGNSEQWSSADEGGGTGSWCCGGSGGMGMGAVSRDEHAILIKKTILLMGC
ncbi:hypothetical protein ARMGADRAFT_464299 [Armillaria gallica]|uniref:Uncharacterized protein n=1 Tax=Armillaria gallica TaxID=47427 RepID=A0A2H3D8Z5_ARMGA|nr:hypothetical protein ARMGADRAFT_464299 [Armillaria gallica]